MASRPPPPLPPPPPLRQPVRGLAGARRQVSERAPEPSTSADWSPTTQIGGTSPSFVTNRRASHRPRPQPRRRPPSAPAPRTCGDQGRRWSPTTHIGGTSLSFVTIRRALVPAPGPQGGPAPPPRCGTERRTPPPSGPPRRRVRPPRRRRRRQTPHPTHPARPQRDQHPDHHHCPTARLGRVGPLVEQERRPRPSRRPARGAPRVRRRRRGCGRAACSRSRSRPGTPVPRCRGWTPPACQPKARARRRPRPARPAPARAPAAVPAPRAPTTPSATARRWHPAARATTLPIAPRQRAEQAEQQRERRTWPPRPSADDDQAHRPDRTPTGWRDGRALAERAGREQDGEEHLRLEHERGQAGRQPGAIAV